MKFRSRLWLFILLMALIIAGSLVYRKYQQAPINIGFAAELTGRNAELGVQERNGVLLAVEEINKSGGIAGHVVKLVVKNDCGKPEKAKTADRELIKAGVRAIIGHATTEQTIAGLEVTDPARVVLLSPTVSTPQLSGLDDYFFRVYPSFNESARSFARYVYKHEGRKKIAIIYDVDNAAYAKTYGSAFKDSFQSWGGKLTGELNYSTSAQPDFTPLLAELRAANPEGLLIIASDVDTALIAQRTRLMGWNVQMFTSAWAQTATLIENGGQAVEGMKLEQSFAANSQSPKFLDFQNRYKYRFGHAPSFGAAFGYEAMQVLAAALEKTGGKADGLRQSLIEVQNYQGLIDKFSFDKFGDVKRPFYLSTISNGQFIILENLAPAEPGGE